MPRCYLMQSRRVLRRPISEIELAQGRQNHYVICDASNGRIHPRITSVLLDPSKSSYSDIEPPIPMDLNHLVYFEMIQGRQNDVKQQMNKLELSPEMRQKVSAAYQVHFGLPLEQAEPETVNPSHGDTPPVSDADMPPRVKGHFRDHLRLHSRHRSDSLRMSSYPAR